MSVVGLAGTTRSAAPNSMSDGSCCSAALKNASPGRNITTNSGVASNWLQYALLASFVMCSRTWRA